RLSYLDSAPSSSTPSRSTDPGRPVILFCHANGFAAGVYQYYLRRLAGQCRVLALDFAGHGESESTLDFSDWDFFRDQVLALLDVEQLSGVIGVGHSLGGASLFRAAAVEPDRLAMVIGLDPVLLSLPRLLLFKVTGNPLS